MPLALVDRPRAAQSEIRIGQIGAPRLTPDYHALVIHADDAYGNADRVERELRDEARLLCGEGLTDEELQRVKAKVIGQKKISRQDLGACASSAALDELYGLGYAHSDEDDARYEAVTPDQVKAAAQRYLKPDAMVISGVFPT